MKASCESAVLPCFGFRQAGDLAYTRREDGNLAFGIIDVSGHGPEAAAVASQLAGWLAEQLDLAPLPLLGALHRRLQGQAAAVAVACRLDLRRGTLAYAAVGDTRLWHLHQSELSMASAQPGLLGQVLPQLQQRDITLRVGEIVIVASDGIPTEAASQIHAAAALPPAQLALLIVRRFGRKTDDASCVVLRCEDD